MTYEDLHPDIVPTVKMVDSMFDEVYLVGGAVRDSLLNKPTLDLDFATSASPNVIEKTLKANQALTVRSEAKAYGTLSVHVGLYDIQITSYRGEQYEPDSRLPSITILTDIDSDLARRDFTINAMALSESEFVDPYNGKGDLENKIIKCVGQPRMRYSEDPLRILRAFRFVAQLGFTIESQSLEAAIESKKLISSLSAERLSTEMGKILAGRYWADCLNELADARILDEVMKRLDLPYHPTAQDFEFEFNNYSSAEFEKMDEAARWAYFIKIIYYSERASGVTSTSIGSSAQNVIQHFFIGKVLRDKIMEIVSQTQDQSTDSGSSLESMRVQVEKYRQAGDARYMIEEGKYLTLKGRYEMEAQNYGLAKRYFTESIKVTEDNYAYILTDWNEDRKKLRLKGIASYYNTRIKYLVTSILFEEKLYQKFHSTKTLRAELTKRLAFKYLNRKTLLELISLAISYVYRSPVHGLTLEPFLKFLDDPTNSLSERQIVRNKRVYIDHEIRNKRMVPEERASLYLMKAELAAKDADAGENSTEYLDPYLDYLYNKMLQQTQMPDFRQYLKKFEKHAEQFMILSDREHRHWFGQRKVSLSAASALVHALSLADKLAEKILISDRIVKEYEQAGYGYEKNQSRYQIYVDWFNVVYALNNTKSNSEDLIDLEEQIKKTASLTYVDPDEGYLANERNDLVQKRQLLKDIYAVISLFTGTQNYSINDQILLSVANLYKNGLINIQIALNAVRNYVFSIEDRQLIIDRMEVLEEEILDESVEELDQYLTGESETLEYKSSWQFDVNAFKHTGTPRNDTALIDVAVKDIAGFMNKSGGILLIGVEDSGNVLGLEETDFKMESNPDHMKKLDNIQLKIRDGIISRIGPAALSNCSITVEKYQNKSVIKINAPPSLANPIIYKEGENEYYYVRSGTSTTNAGFQAASEKIRLQGLVSQASIVPLATVL